MKQNGSQFEITQASRKNVPLKISISGSSGSGKTMSSILLAKGLLGPEGKCDEIIIIDTENQSSKLYAHLGNFRVLTLTHPFSPQRYIDAMKFVFTNVKPKVLIIDSASHEWDGKGGCLDIQASLGGRFSDWAKVTPMHNSFIDAIVNYPNHVITTTRRKTEWALEQNEKNKLEPKKVGLSHKQRDGFEYEFTIEFVLDSNHMATVSKDRTSIFHDSMPFVIDENTGVFIREWNMEADKQLEDIKSKALANSADSAVI